MVRAPQVPSRPPGRPAAIWTRCWSGLGSQRRLFCPAGAASAARKCATPPPRSGWGGHWAQGRATKRLPPRFRGATDGLRRTGRPRCARILHPRQPLRNATPGVTLGSNLGARLVSGVQGLPIHTCFHFKRMICFSFHTSTGMHPCNPVCSCSN